MNKENCRTKIMGNFVIVASGLPQLHLLLVKDSSREGVDA